MRMRSPWASSSSDCMTVRPARGALRRRAAASAIMKQKFYSQVKMERVFFFQDGRPDARLERPRTGGKHEIRHHRRGSNRQDSRRQCRRAQGLRGALRRRRRRGRGREPRGRDGRQRSGRSTRSSRSSDVDAVAICAPTDTHAELIERAARAKKAIFCEKPIDLDADADREDASKSSSRPARR